MAYDENQRFIAFVPGGNGVIYAIQADGELLWYQHTGWQNGAVTWAPASGTVIGTGWQEFTTVLASQDGQIFGFKADGTVLWYKLTSMNANTGAHSWASRSGAQIGAGFNEYARMIGGWYGVMYGIDFEGDIHFYYYAAGDGTVGWGDASGTPIGAGFNQLLWLWADPDGVLYGVRQSGVLYWWRYIVSNVDTGAGVWANGGNEIQIGEGWGDGGAMQRTAFSNTNGVIYTVELDGSENPGTDNILAWYRLANQDTIESSGVAWYNGGNATAVGNGFTIEPSAALQGYPTSLSTPQGGSVGIHVSTTWPSYTASILRVAPAPAPGSPVTVVPAASHTGVFKQLRSGYRANGCGWSTDFTVSPTTSWESGVYCAQLTSPQGNQHNVMFVVRPLTPTNKIAVVVPSNTYNAYNTWGGHDQYTQGEDDMMRTITFQRPSVQTAINATGVLSHTLYSDLLLLTFMTANNIAYDVYTDQDVDSTGAVWMKSYKAVVICSHPEYWTGNARQNVVDYVDGTGRLIVTGGNAFFEEITYNASGTAGVYRTSTGDRNLFSNLGLFESDIDGLDYNAATYLDFYPYQVQTQHAFLNGTGLAVGDLFGASGYNVAASGWEVDWAASGITGLVVIAQGTNPNGGASMAYLPKSGGGWTFATGSISFNGSIPSDSAIQTILTNVFTAAVA